jgi:oxygen-independent coproporphyrinogen-3 oxidase
MTEVGLAQLHNSGFSRYEVSAFSKSHKQSRHNINYWSFGDYLGIGAGAHGKISTPGEEFIIERTTKTRSPGDYLVNPNRQSNIVSKESLILEFLMNALRMTGGFSQSLFEQRTGLDFDQLQSFISEGTSKQLLETIDTDNTDNTDDLTIRPTDLGMRYLDELLPLETTI